MKQLGLFGGSFNPIHSGHLHLALGVRKYLQLDGVLLMPTGEAPHKDSSAYAPAADRLAMCRLAAKNRPWLSVSDWEMTRPGRSYTVETLRHLTQTQPDVQWTLMIGSDMLLTFDQWRCWQEILSMARVCAVSRETGDRPALLEKAEMLCKVAPGAEVTVCPLGAKPVSSTQIRTMLQKGQDASCLLPKNVVQYIQEHRLYGTGGAGLGQGSTE